MSLTFLGLVAIGLGGSGGDLMSDWQLAVVKLTKRTKLQ